ncbi:Type IV secretory pathway, component VirB8 [Tistlia consotensis]|uniref:Type IV secretory pathway, component VirB8 n=2 Tax=Tistlia TaxID=1321364 RepID=A0A1Y6CXM6_9PROT|nr:Type IV secretory pathway, component VirB8 [Tistlia consotensis USBA 355]SNS24982.1 Type IV secretory pathway, component VirB8 [Tistlia consotensis]
MARQAHPAASAGDLPAPAALGPDLPGRHDTGHAYRRLDKTNRILAFLLVGSWAVNALLATGYFILLPLKQVEPWLLTVSPESKQVVTVEPLHRDLDAWQAATTQWVAQWVTQRHTVLPDRGHTEARLKWLYLRSVEKPVYEDIESPEEKRFTLDMIRRGGSRTVKIESVSRVAEDFYLVNFETQDSFPHQTEVQRSRWTATVRIAFRPVDYARGEIQSGEARDRLLSFGFTVVDYTVQPSLT